MTAGRAACLGERWHGARSLRSLPPLAVEGTSEDPMAAESVKRDQTPRPLRALVYGRVSAPWREANY